MRIAVTGGSGFVGGHTARARLSRGDDVVVIARRNNPALHEGGQMNWVSRDIDDEAALRQAFEGCGAVIHCAGINLERGGQTYDRPPAERFGCGDLRLCSRTG